MHDSHPLNQLKSPSIAKAEEKCWEAKRQLIEIVGEEVFSATARAYIVQAASDYAKARVGILEAKIGEEAHSFVQRDMNAFFNTMAAHGFSPSKGETGG